MLIETIALAVGLAIAGAWGVEKVVDVKKHNATLEADIQTQCFKHAKEIRECKYLE